MPENHCAPRLRTGAAPRGSAARARGNAAASLCAAFGIWAFASAPAAAGTVTLDLVTDEPYDGKAAVAGAIGDIPAADWGAWTALTSVSFPGTPVDQVRSRVFTLPTETGDHWKVWGTLTERQYFRPGATTPDPPVLVVFTYRLDLKGQHLTAPDPDETAPNALEMSVWADNLDFGLFGTGPDRLFHSQPHLTSLHLDTMSLALIDLNDEYDEPILGPDRFELAANVDLQHDPTRPRPVPLPPAAASGLLLLAGVAACRLRVRRARARPRPSGTPQ